MIGKVKIVIRNGKPTFEGTIPDVPEGVELVVMRTSDLELIIRSDENALLVHPYEMPKDLWDCNVPEHFPNEISYLARDGTKHKLFLDRKIYGTNLKDIVWIRYSSIDQGFYEEQP